MRRAFFVFLICNPDASEELWKLTERIRALIEYLIAIQFELSE